MKRLLLCLPICLLLAPENLPPITPTESSRLEEVVDDGSRLPTVAEMDRLAETDPVAFVEKTLVRYEREVEGYRVLFQKKERVLGTVYPVEKIDVAFREKPFSVRFFWKEGAREASRVLYVEGENDGKLVAKGASWRALVGLQYRAIDSDDAKKSGRYPITEFGMKVGAQRTLGAWIDARKNGTLKVEYLGEKSVSELDGRLCWVLRRTGYQEAEEDGIGETTLYFDKETWLQTGAVLRTRTGGFIADYWFRNIELNPTFPADTFTTGALRK